MSSINIFKLNTQKILMSKCLWKVLVPNSYIFISHRPTDQKRNKFVQKYNKPKTLKTFLSML